MYWLGSTIQNLVKQSDASNVGSLWQYNIASLSGSGYAGTNPTQRGPFDARERQVYGAFVLGQGESYVSACNTITVSSGQQVIASGCFKPSVAGTIYAVTPHGRVGITYSFSLDVFSYFSETTSAQAYLDESNIDPVTKQFDGWFRLKLSITARSTGSIAPLLFRAGLFTGTYSENPGGNTDLLFTAAQVVINPTSRIYGVPAYIATTGTNPSSNQMSGVEINASNVSIGKRRVAGRSTTKDADLFSYKWGVAKTASMNVNAILKSDAAKVNSYWEANETVIFMNTNMPFDVLSGTLTNEKTPIGMTDISGDSGPYQRLNGVIRLESF